MTTTTTGYEKTHIDFLRNPQQCGAWCLRVKFPDTVYSTLGKLLNMNSGILETPRNRMSRRIYQEEIGDVTPAVLLRLFVYLRACQPKKVTDELPNLTTFSESNQRRLPPWLRHRELNYEIRELCTPPTRLSSSKRAALAKAAKHYLQFFSHFTCTVVPGEPGKVDFRDKWNSGYFQASQEPQGVLKILSVDELLLTHLRALFDALPNASFSYERLRVYSPESVLMGLYVPITNLISLSSVLADSSTIKNTTQILDEIREERFVHAVRATGIAVEELLVEIYETYTHEKAPPAPLGELLSGLQSKLKEIVSGNQSKEEVDCTTARKQLGQIIQAEKKKGSIDGPLFALIETLQKSVLPVIEQVAETVTENGRLSQRESKVALFPMFLQRCIGELVALRNRVSHRVERVTSVTNVGYLEASIALRAYIILATWWHAERSVINYKQSRKAIVAETTRRSADLNCEKEASE